MRLTKKILVCLGIVGVLQISPFGIVQQAIGKEVYKIGVTYPLSGGLSGWAILLTAMQIAVDEQNGKGGIKGGEVKLLIEDSKGSPEAALAATRKLIEFDKVPVVMSIMTNVLLAQIPYADSKGIVLISPTQAPGMAERGQWNFVFSIQLEDECAALFDEAKRLGLKRLFSFEPDNAWGRFMVDLVKKKWVEERGGVHENVWFKYGETDYRGLLPRAKEFKPDALFCAAQGSVEGSLIVKQVREAGIKTLFLMSSTEIAPFARKVFKGFEEGIIFSDLPKAGEKIGWLEQEFKKRTGEDSWVHVPILYDQVRVIMEAIDKAGYSAKGIREYLVNLKNFPSTGGGTYGFDRNKLAKPTDIKLYQFREGKVVPYRD